MHHQQTALALDRNDDIECLPETGAFHDPFRGFIWLQKSNSGTRTLKVYSSHPGAIREIPSHLDILTACCEVVYFYICAATTINNF